MHLLVPFAAPPPEDDRKGSGSWPLPRLPQLRALLAGLTEVERDHGDEWSYSPPHERALARALGWQVDAASDGRQPWAARAAQADGLATGSRAWGLVTPAHWHLGTDQVGMLDPLVLGLDESASREVFDAVQPLFGGAGFELHYVAPLRWYMVHESLAALRCASLDRVVGRNVDAWLGSDAAAARVRRLQSEVQMHLYTHALTAQREALGQLPVNSFWLSGCGVAQVAQECDVRVDERLRAPALAQDAAGWHQAWRELDAGPLAELRAAAQRGEAVQLTLCGERASARFASARRGVLQRLRSLWAADAVPSVLGSL
jgi:hypothetical protein